MGPHISDAATLRRAFARVPSPIVAVCADTGTERIGMAVSTFTPVSLAPPLVSICIQNTSSTWPQLAAQSRLGVSVLSSTHAEIVRVLAAKDSDRFAGVDTEPGSAGALFISRAALGLGVSIERQIPAGDHTIVLLYVHELHHPDDADAAVEPIIFHGSSMRSLATP